MSHPQKHRFIRSTQEIRDLAQEAVQLLAEETPTLVAEGSLYSYGLPDVCKTIVREFLKADEIKKWARMLQLEVQDPGSHPYRKPEVFLYKGGILRFGENNTSLLIPLSEMDKLKVNILTDRTQYPIEWDAMSILQLYKNTRLRSEPCEVVIICIILPIKTAEEKGKEEEKKKDTGNEEEKKEDEDEEKGKEKDEGEVDKSVP